MNQHQQKRESFYKFNFKFSKLIQVVTNHESKDVKNSLKIYMYAEKVTPRSVLKQSDMHTEHYKSLLILHTKLRENSSLLKVFNKWSLIQ